MESFVFGISILTIVKGFLVFAFLIYTIFAGVIIKQVRLMGDTFKIGFEKNLNFLAIIHLIFAAGVLLLSIIVL